mgnify:CR=1 FL=1
MPRAKDIVVKPLESKMAREFVQRWHYSGKTYPKSSLHLGAFLGGRLVGVMQFGDPLDRSKVIGLVKDTKWHNMLELNRMAMIDDTPKNTESRFISIAMKMIKKSYPSIEWVLSFSDGCQCGDGTIYRASGFVLTGIKKNTGLYEYNGEVFTAVGLDTSSKMRARFSSITGGTIVSYKDMIKYGATKLTGFQLRYIYFLNPAARQRLTVPVIPFSKIDEIGASMYKGESIKRDTKATTSDQLVGGGAIPTITLHSPYAASKKTHEA